MKVSLKTYILTIIIVILICTGFIYAKLDEQEKKNEIVSQNTNKLEQIESEYEEENREEVNEEEIIKNELNEGFVDYSNDTENLEDEVGETIKPENSLEYSILKEYDYSGYKNYCTEYMFRGDSAAWEVVENNYDSSNNIKIGKYTNPIEYKVAVLNESAEYDDSMTLDEKVTKMWNAIKDDEFYNTDKYKVNGISIMNGNNNGEEDYYNNARAKKIKVTINNEEEHIFELIDTNSPQVFELGIAQQDISKPMEITVEVLEIYSGRTSDNIYINEIGFGIETGGLGAR